MIIDILQHTPVWVWVVLAAVLCLGFLQVRDREVSRSRAVTLPCLFILLSLSAVLRSPSSSALPLAGWVLGFALAWSLGFPLVAVRGAQWLAESARIHVPGSWVPLTLMGGLFLLKYGVGIAMSVDPTVHAHVAFLVVTNVAYGGFAGAFWARSRSLLAVKAVDEAQARSMRDAAAAI
jgi:hypothetical protein